MDGTDLSDVRQHWRDLAACIGHHQRIWFPFNDDRNHEHHPNHKVQIEKETAAYNLARTICGGCPVRETCLDWALTNGEIDHGMYGGLTPRERRRMRRKRIDARMAPTPRDCAVCGLPFVQTQPGQRLCSDDCRREADRRAQADYRTRQRPTKRRQPTSCRWCGETFTPTTGSAYCTDACRRMGRDRAKARSRVARNPIAVAVYCRDCGWPCAGQYGLVQHRSRVHADEVAS